MKWIKASEKTPEKDGYYITVCRCEDNDMVLPLTTSDTYFTNNEWKDTYGWEVIKWLDETDTDNWISVEDGLPEIGENILVSIENGWNTLMGNLYNDGWMIYYQDGFKKEGDDKVTHWQPLPTPPNK